MASYATPAELRAYLLDNPAVRAPADDAAAERLLQRAEHDVDRQLGTTTRDPVSGLAFGQAALAALSVGQLDALMRATCAAAEFRLLAGEEILVGSEDGIAAVGGLSFSQRPPRRIAPKVAEELAGSGLVSWSGTVEEDAAV